MLRHDRANQASEDSKSVTIETAALVRVEGREKVNTTLRKMIQGGCEDEQMRQAGY